MSTTALWAVIAVGFVAAMVWAWRVCRETPDEREEWRRHLQHLDAMRGRK